MIRKMNDKDKSKYIELSLDFYQSEAVIEHVEMPISNLEQTFDLIISDSPYLEGYVYTYYNKVVAYCLLSFTYSNELGGLMVLLEELYVDPKYQGLGIGKKFLNYIEKVYKDSAIAIRLEIDDENGRAKKLYLKQGFEEREYSQMVKIIDEE
ncbi:Acyl-CoA N-acyltransferase [Alteracholeplasma palmae J233]|uniref:Acyl-CoA N-acyltransferase n=1 Tax=Alteracholeplasma palmae (strain ATCC 49389 / J233) TaxID=1318466 RepID=U4KRN4_ALTPJ|nr:GNAT family N-acetyltransferase [Alteracholeplasma palmae]CCV64321.1 Acyl-CoA N-acyltransferase [Alteracholeplasma palmae J233]